MSNIIIGISAYYHDSAACVIQDGKIIAAAQEERFTRIKHDSLFPSRALDYVLSKLDTDPSLVSHIAFYDKPLLKFERLLETYHAFIPGGMASFNEAIPIWLREKLFIRRNIRKELEKHGLGGRPILFPEHHLSHAASAFYPSPFNEAAILTVDGVGEWTTTAIAVGKGNKIKILKEIHFPHSLGLLYSAFTYYCGFRVNSGEYKLMGLAPYGDDQAQETITFQKKILSHLIDIRPDGSFVLNMKFFSYTTGLKMTHNRRWKELFGIPPRRPETEIHSSYCNMALAIQRVTEQVMLRLAKTAKELTGSDNLVMAGGVALNSVSNGKLERSGIFDRIWVQPAAGDAGGSVGAALATHHIYLDKPLSKASNLIDGMQGAFLGPGYSDKEILRTLSKYNATYIRIDEPAVLCKKTARLISEGKIAGWFQGNMEFGPRALGNRSILADPRNKEMQKKLNLSIKYRESFRPFAPAVLAENAQEIFDTPFDSPYMLVVCPVKDTFRKPLPDNYQDLSLQEKLYHERSALSSITHVDFSARIQTVHKKTNPLFYKLIEEIKYITGFPVVINTSFNVRGEPIVCSPEDAFICFMRTEMDVLVLGNYLLYKTEQTQVKELPKFNIINSLD